MPQTIENIGASEGGRTVVSSLEGRRRAALGRDHVGGLLRRFQMMIDAQDLCAFARKGERGGAAVADAFARRRR